MKTNLELRVVLLLFYEHYIVEYLLFSYLLAVQTLLGDIKSVRPCRLIFIHYKYQLAMICLL